VNKRTKKEYTTEFRERAVGMVISSDKSTVQIAKEKSVAVVNNEPSNEQLFDELKRLKKELAEVKEQRDILKKATAYFAKESR